MLDSSYGSVMYRSPEERDFTRDHRMVADGIDTPSPLPRAEVIARPLEDEERKGSFKPAPGIARIGGRTVEAATVDDELRALMKRHYFSA